MFKVIKEKIWDLLKEKHVSLAMLYDRQGNILWHKGRKISGNTIADGEGFTKSYIKQAFINGQVVDTAGFLISCADSDKNVPESAVYLKIKSLLINQVNSNFFLYVDSGTKKAFSENDCNTIQTLGRVLGDTINTLENETDNTNGITGSSAEIKEVRQAVMKYALADEPILLLGDTGTGKTHIAQLIHKYSGREGKFIIINTPGIPETLFESELFGHARGAFTDAFTEKKGLVEAAAGGTLFIDEITEVSMAMQAKLLRFIETSRFTPLGEVEEKEVDVRIVAATNKNLQRAIKKKEFREDLYYRLNVFELEIPCLRDRKEDIRPLVEQEIRYLQEKTIGEGFWGAMLEYDWPGNVRQLISVLKRMGFYHKDEIGDADVRNILNNTAAAGTVDVSENESGAGRLWSILREGGNFWEVVKKPFLARDLNRAEVKSLIALGLEQTGGKYKKLLKIFNMDNDDYHRFMRFIHEQDLKP